MRRPFRLALALAIALIAGVGTSCDDPGITRGAPFDSDSAELLSDLTSYQIFPADNWWNLDVSAAPLDPDSDTLLHFISARTAADPGANRQMHPDFGPPPYGIPYMTVGPLQPLVPVTFTLYGSQSDSGPPGPRRGYPITRDAKTLPNYIEGGIPGGGSSGDRHMIMMDGHRGLLFETWATRWNASAGRWEAGSGAIFDLTSNARRPEGWTSADAAGLAILPGLVRYDEYALDEPITHAFRVTVRATNGHVWPASHTAGDTPGAPPMGMRLRLKASVDISGYPAGIRRIFQAMKTYGLIVADNGSDLYVSGTMDARWDNDVLNPAFHSLHANDFEVVQRGWGAPP